MGCTKLDGSEDSRDLDGKKSAQVLHSTFGAPYIDIHYISEFFKTVIHKGLVFHYASSRNAG
jgi:hypothetical protein